MEQADSTGFGMKSMMFGIRKKFSSVQQMSTDSLYQILFPNGTLQKSMNNLLIFDVREGKERDISSIPNSIWIDTSKDIGDNVQIAHGLIKCHFSVDQHQSLSIIAYCSIGYRSSEFITALNQLCFHENYPFRDKIKTYNLEGSIFKWANENRPLVGNDNNFTSFVHPYNMIWGALLNSDYHKL